jgi:hypothetical protein
MARSEATPEATPEEQTIFCSSVLFMSLNTETIVPGRQPWGVPHESFEICRTTMLFDVQRDLGQNQNVTFLSPVGVAVTPLVVSIQSPR